MAERVQVEELETSKPRTREFKVTVREEATRKGLEKIARKVSRQIRIPGFRPGRAPYPIVERYVGREYLMREFLADELDALIKEALDEANVSGDISLNLIDVEWEQPSFHLEVGLEPHVELGDYMSIRIPYEEPQVTDQEVDEFFQEVLKSRSTYEEVNEPAKEGDMVDAVVTIRVGDETVINGEEVSASTETELYLPGFSEALVGASPGDVLDFTLPIPEDHMWRKHGEEAQVHVEVRRVHRLVLPELTLELAQELNPDVESVDELRNIVKENLQFRKRVAARRAYREKVMQALEEKATVEYPPLLVDEKLDEHIRDLQEYARSLRLEWEQYLSFLGRTEEQIREENREKIEEALRQDLIIAAIAREQNLKPGDREWEEYSRELVVDGFTGEDLQRALSEDERFRKQIALDLFRFTVLEFMARVARGELDKGEAEEEETSAEAETSEQADTAAEDTTSAEAASAADTAEESGNEANEDAEEDEV